MRTKSLFFLGLIPMLFISPEMMEAKKISKPDPFKSSNLQDDIEMKGVNPRMYQIAEEKRLHFDPSVYCMQYSVLVPSDISKQELKATIKKLIVDESTKNPDLGIIKVFV